MSKLFYGKVINGTISLENNEAFNNYIESLEDSDIIINISEDKDIRTHKQNKYYFGLVLTCLSEYTGYSNAELHRIFSEFFLKGKSTKNLNTYEFIVYVNNIRDWVASELSFYIPEANEYIS